MDYVSENHSKHLIMCHLIFVCKYRKSLLLKFGDFIKKEFHRIESISDFKIVEMEVDINHIHILVKYKPKISILQIVRKLKQISTVNIWKSYSEELKVHFWKENTFWSDGYFACSIGNVSKETIEKYIRNKYRKEI